MNDIPAIQVNNLSKSYTIKHNQSSNNKTLKDDFANILKRSRNGGKSDEEFWALKNVSFEVKKGELFGVIGSNGSGKSTLLKILSRIIDPTQGEVRINGKVASLLEVGTGFHPDLTGRENIYFNGSMLGMSRKEIEKKFNDIVDFAEVEKFIDTPVKFYSSGMYVRLAFAVAAHLDPEILILDEVLAVGDAAFQKKSLRKVQETLNDGKTVLFVSHDMAAIRQLCSRGIVLDKGKIVMSGTVDNIIESYSTKTEKIIEKLSNEDAGIEWHGKEGLYDDIAMRPLSLYITDDNGNKINSALDNTRSYYINIELFINKIDPKFNVGYSLWSSSGELYYMSMSTDASPSLWPKLTKGKNILRSPLPHHSINSGEYIVKMISSIYGERWILEPDSSQCKIAFRMRHGKQKSPLWKDTRGGLFAPIIEWKRI